MRIIILSLAACVAACGEFHPERLRAPPPDQSSYMPPAPYVRATVSPSPIDAYRPRTPDYGPTAPGYR